MGSKYIEIRIIDSLFFDESKKTYGCKSKNGKLVELSARQGTLDGACGFYSLIYCLLIQKFITAKDIDTAIKNPEESNNDLLNYMFEKCGMYRDGLTVEQIKRILKNRSEFKAEAIMLSKDEEENLCDKVADYLDQGVPVMIGVDWNNNGDGHWLVAVGYENKTKKDTSYVEKLFCIDPDPEAGDLTHAPWNALIETPWDRKGQFPYTYNGNGVAQCRMTEAIVFKLK